MKTTKRNVRRSFPLRLERLEPRQCLSASGITVIDHTLTIVGDTGSDTITITDDGQGDINASLTLSNGNTVTGGGTDIRHVIVNGGKGSDSLSYSLTNQLTHSESLEFNLGSGSDIVKLDFTPGVETLTTPSPATTASISGAAALPSPTELDVDLNGGAGADNVNFNLGDVTDSRVDFYAQLGAGADSFQGSLGNLVGQSSVAVAVNGGHGADAITLSAASNVSAESKLDVALSGGDGADQVDFNYSGVLNGTLRSVADGGGGDDTVATNLTVDPGSTGKLHGAVFGGEGDDNETFNFIDNSGGAGNPSTLSVADAEIGNVLGTNTLTYTHNVNVIT